ncbi:hypothetical protein B0H67DRAFT_552006 [Lasiosphaeris hirsuta]|uniref:MICOS complex subunit MIC12 n=1 Tax=Lasiosphaeris hirsuta TaxID=260670 RepID=A0AA40DZV2_9PEZI|nr:hypothetical protein B0H67DRAFT_552006 [Lasiosphaeris hirsuta]
MGFVTGFTGGVTLTLSLTYLALLTHAHSRQSQADTLRAQTRVVSSLARDPTTPRRSRYDPETTDEYPPSRAEQSAQHRADFVAAAKDRWNSEIEGALRWAQTRNWTGTREDAEARLAELGPVARRGADEVRSELRSVTEGAKSAIQGAGKRAAEVGTGVGAEVREDARVAVAKGKEIVKKTKAAVYLAEEKAVTKADAKIFKTSEIDTALAQRYEKDDSIMKKSVQEILAERYKPFDQRDNTRLRGL